LATGDAAGSAWRALGPFRIVQPAGVTLHGPEFGGWQLTVAQEASAELDSLAFAAPAQASWELVSPGGRWHVETGPLPQRDDAQRRLDGVLRAPMPGKVLAVTAQPGQPVAEGDVVALLDAMKIEITLAAPFAGRVSEVHVAAGALVGSRQPVVTIVPEAGEHES
jgi:biotin carboxyl carrier protein